MNIKFPFMISLLGIVLGIFIAILFGINEDIFKDRISKGIEQNPKYQSMSSTVEQAEYKKKEEEKNWRYYQRYHFHSTAINSMSIALILLVLIVNISTPIQIYLSYMISISGLLYPFIWLFAGIFGPLIGRGVAKEKFAVLGYMGGVYMIAVTILLVLVGLKGVHKKNM